MMIAIRVFQVLVGSAFVLMLIVWFFKKPKGSG
jgi:hypothetical protein